MSHRLVKCKSCQKVIEQCRCMKSPTTITWSLCAECKRLSDE